MDTGKLRECLCKYKKEELGIPIVLPSMSDNLQSLFQWAVESSPVEGRQLWFVVGNAKEVLQQLPPIMRGRVFPVEGEHLSLIFKRGPYDALLLPKHGFMYSDPNLLVTDFWKQRGNYRLCEEFVSEELQLWFWVSTRTPLKLFGMDHHHAVLWDVKKILRPLGVQLDFVWLSDGRDVVNEAMPCQIPGFFSSLDIYKQPADKPLSEETKKFILEDGYQGIITSHSLVTCHRLQELGLPMIHVNSTRFGNEWIHSPKKHETLVNSIQELLRKKRLRIVHNNHGDQQYVHQYIPSIQANQEVVIPSLCESLLRLRCSPPAKPKIMIWDTRQTLLQKDKSPFMKEFYIRCKYILEDNVESQAILLSQHGKYLPEGYLDQYTAVVHIPYNISTMSMFEQVRANIPIWVPSKRLMKELWSNTEEPNELSWTVFVPGSEKNASTMDNVRNPEVIQRWLDAADFYNPEVLPLALTFDSIDEFLQKVLTTDYQALMDKAEETQQIRRENIAFAWEQVLQHLT